ncbi:MAG TPA: C25 family cysteine peptidase, partial [Blastocatellia bacterium]|nr:C25 family cysteine peptidase [Blastocatellia bacterium]
QKLVNYAGHASVNVWRGNLLTSEESHSLENGERLSVFVMMNCLNGYFQDVALDSLAESLLKAERGGAVAVWASSAMTYPDQQALMNREFYRQLGNRSLTLGEAAARAKAAVLDPDVRRSWILLGDPTTRIK